MNNKNRNKKEGKINNKQSWMHPILIGCGMVEVLRDWREGCGGWVGVSRGRCDFWWIQAIGETRNAIFEPHEYAPSPPKS